MFVSEFYYVFNWGTTEWDVHQPRGGINPEPWVVEDGQLQRTAQKARPGCMDVAETVEGKGHFQIAELSALALKHLRVPPRAL